MPFPCLTTRCNKKGLFFLGFWKGSYLSEQKNVLKWCPGRSNLISKVHSTATISFKFQHWNPIPVKASSSWRLYSCITHFLAGAALIGELLLETGDTEVAVIFGDEGLGSYRLLAALTQKAGLVPAVPLVLHFPRAYRKDKQERYFYPRLQGHTCFL